MAFEAHFLIKFPRRVSLPLFLRRRAVKDTHTGEEKKEKCGWGEKGKEGRTLPGFMPLLVLPPPSLDEGWGPRARAGVVKIIKPSRELATLPE